MKLLRCSLLASLLAFSTSSPSGALAQEYTLLTNLPSNNGGGGPVTTSEQRAVTFTTLASPFLVTEVRMSLENYISLEDDAMLSIHLNGTNAPGARIGDFFTAPTSTSDATSVFAFTSPGIQLAPHTTYWVVIRAGNPETFRWNRSDPTFTPVTTEFASFGNQWITYNSGGLWEVGSNGAHSFEVVGVPEPAAAAWIFGAGILGLAAMRWAGARVVQRRSGAGAR